MYLQHVKIQNFRNLADVELELQPGLNTFVGPNNIGKTNIFSAIRHALGPASARGEPLWLTEDDIRRDQKGSPVGDSIRISLSFAELNENQRAFFFEILDVPPGTEIEAALARVHFEAAWNTERNRFSVKRWGASVTGERSSIPNEILEALPITFLPALRDAEEALTPGNKNRLARLFQDLAKPGGRYANEIINIFQEANEQLEGQRLVRRTQLILNKSTSEMAGTEFQECAINAASPELNKIFRTLSLKLTGNPIPDISTNGLGYNNLLYVATVLAHLERVHEEDCPILLIEEPEAHLHPQLTVLLGEYLQNRLAEDKPPQAIVSTHSPIFATNVKPSRVSIMYKDHAETVQVNCLFGAEFTDREEKQLQRMLDVTRATLYFCKGLILVEGISEALLIPEFAKRLDLPADLAHQQISVLPIAGVSFNTFKKLFSPQALGIPVAIISDADPRAVPENSGWPEVSPAKENGEFEISPRALRLQEEFAGAANVGVFLSRVTLEYDLAEAGDSNPAVMATVWEDCFPGTPRTFNRRILVDAGDELEERALATWRGICQAPHSGSKAHFAHLLVEWLSENEGEDFAVPQYIQDAINHVVPEKPEE